jgi:hypothetical protein
MPALPGLATDGQRRFSTALLDASGRIRDRGIVTALDWKPGDRLLITQIRSSAVICRRGDGVFRMTTERYVVLPAPVRHGWGVLADSRVLRCCAGFCRTVIGELLHQLLLVRFLGELSVENKPSSVVYHPQKQDRHAVFHRGKHSLTPVFPQRRPGGSR